MQADSHTIRLENLPDDAVSYRMMIDGRRPGLLADIRDADVLSAEITYSDRSVETISTDLK